MTRTPVPTSLVFFLTAMILALQPSAAGAQDPPDGDGWKSLFNGRDLSGWVTPKQEHTWSVVGGVIDYDAKGGNLTSAQQYGNYELHIEWRFKRTVGKPYNAKIFNSDGTQKTGTDGKPLTQPIANADSGIFVRGSGQSQVNLWCWPCGSGQLWAFHQNDDPKIRAGAMPSANADKPVGEWNQMLIKMQGHQITIVLNGKKILDRSAMPGIPARGPIVLQHHGGLNEKNKTWSSASALIQFRNIWIREL